MSNLVEHAKREFLKLGYKPINECEDDPDKWIQENVLELLEVFSKQGHSGSSAPFAVSYFTKLASFLPIAPITCEEDEWVDVGNLGDDDTFQNNRCSAVFKNGKDGKPYYLDAIVWRYPDGSAFTGTVEGIGSRQFIKLPFIPKTFYVDVTDGNGEENSENKIIDRKQLDAPFEYYNH